MPFSAASCGCSAFAALCTDIFHAVDHAHHLGWNPGQTTVDRVTALQMWSGHAQTTV